MQRLSMDAAEIKEHYHAVVVGSGYGGGIAASRIARAKQSVCVMERGKELLPGEYPSTQLHAMEEMQVDLPGEHLGNRTALYDLRVNHDIAVFQGCGLGGTSLVNANVSLRAEPQVFQSREWPTAIRQEAERMANGNPDTLLAKGYALAEEMLKPVSYPATQPTLPKLVALEQSAARINGKFYRPPINVTFEDKINHVGVEQHKCALCGDCITGCNHGAKNTVLMNYLPDARNHGAEIFSEVEVRYLERRGSRWLVHYRLLGKGRERFRSSDSFLTADIVVLAAGTLGSTEILLRSREHGLEFSPLLGKRFTGNGDVLGFGYNSDVPIGGIGFGAHSENGRAPVGPCITGIIDLRDQPHLSESMVIEDGAIPGAVAAPLPEALAAAALLEGETVAAAAASGESPSVGGGALAGKWSRAQDSLVHGPYHGAVHNTQTYLVMSHDGGEGEMYLEHDRLRIRWPGVGDQAIFQKINERLRQATEALGGTHVHNPIWSRFLHHQLITVHPLGGCVMGEGIENGVVNHKGQVFNPSGGVHEGLYVCDGAVIPRSLGVNPLLTISALAERSCLLMVEDYGWTIDYTLAAAPQRTDGPRTVGIEFTEKMAGYFSLNVQDTYERGAEQGRAESSPIQFVLTIVADDLHAFVTDEAHVAGIWGTVEAPALSPHPLCVSEGTFNLFTKKMDEVETRNMIYCMRLTSEEGREFFFEGFKVIRDDGILNVWRDTSTLYVTIYEGENRQGKVLGKGVMVIHTADFLRQLSTMRATNAASVADGLKATAEFGRFFAGILLQTYGGMFAPHAYMDPSAPPRRRRTLRVPAPEVHFFEAHDHTHLRLTRHRGGPKGPVLLSHGLGVSSLIFSIDTINTNLLEYLVAHGFDVWLLDHRASIDLPASRTQFSADDIALYDYPAAADKVRQISGSDSIQIVAHGYGGTALFMAMMTGLQAVRSVVCSQAAAHMVSPRKARIRAGLHVPELLHTLGIDSLSAEARGDERWYEKLYDRALQVWAGDEECHSAVCRRISFIYGPLYRHEKLNEATHEVLHEMFGVASTSALDHLALLARVGHLVDAKGQEAYMHNLRSLSVPICFIHGAANECVLPESTQATYDSLCAMNGRDSYTRHVIPGYGNSDCIFGKDAARDVYPYMLEHLERTSQ